jgi:hypothetical protein
MILDNTGWIHLAQDYVKFKGHLDRVMNFLLSQKTGISWLSALLLASQGLLHIPTGDILSNLAQFVRLYIVRWHDPADGDNVAWTILAHAEIVSQLFHAKSEQK